MWAHRMDNLEGKTNCFDIFIGLFFLSTSTICGITSPALWIVTTTSLILTSFLIISSLLCSVALETTYSHQHLRVLIFATGVKAPVLPICISIFNILEYSFCSWKFVSYCPSWWIRNIAQVCPVAIKSLTLYTIPSISYSISWSFVLNISIIIHYLGWLHIVIYAIVFD